MARPDVEWVEPNLRERRLQVPPSDPLFTQQWWLQPISGSIATTDARLRGVPDSRRRGCAPITTPVVVAVLDTGITTHEDLSTSRILPGRDFVSDVDYANDGDGWDTDPSDPGDYVSSADLANPLFSGCSVENSSWHGTIIAGIVAAHTGNGIGGAGVHWGALILPVRVAGKCGADLADIIDGMRWAAGLEVRDDNGKALPVNPKPARIINISFGGSAACGPAYQSRGRRIARHRRGGGRGGRQRMDRPVASGQLPRRGRRRRPQPRRFQDQLFQLRRPDRHQRHCHGRRRRQRQGAWGPVLADSGLTTLTNRGTTVPGSGGYARLYGTSFAAPQVAGDHRPHAEPEPGAELRADRAGPACQRAPSRDLAEDRRVLEHQSRPLHLHHQHLRRRHPRCGSGADLCQRPGAAATCRLPVIDNADIDAALALAAAGPAVERGAGLVEQRWRRLRRLLAAGAGHGGTDAAGAAQPSAPLSLSVPQRRR